jgi:hypothetical protein
MTQTSRSHAGFAAVALLVAALGGADWYLQPDRAAVWAAGMATMGASWIIVVWMGRRGSPDGEMDSHRKFLLLAPVLAGLIIAVSLGVKLLALLGLEYGTGPDRAFGIVLGLILAIMGNMLPKMLKPLSVIPAVNVRRQSAQRFSGWAFSIAGLGYAAAWAFAPLARAAEVSMAVCGTALMLVLASWALGSRSSSRGTPLP